MADNLHLFIVRLFAPFTHDYAVVVNLYFLATFGLAAISCLWVLRKIGARPGPAVVCSVLFALLPYHFVRGESHLFLAAYYPVPLAGYFLVLATRGDPLWRQRADSWRKRLLSAKSLSVVGCAFLIGSCSSYYALFTAVLLVPALLVAVFRSRRVAAGLPGVVLIALVLAVQFGNLLPDLFYQHANGTNTAVSRRNPAETEVYSLKLAQLVLPIENHRLASLAELRHRYVRDFPLPSEGQSAALGLTASIGLLWLLALPALGLFAPSGWRPALAHRELSLLAVCGFFLATTGGFATLTSLLITSELRAWSRMSIFLGFFSLAAVALLLGGLGDRLEGRGLSSMSMVVLPAVLLVGVTDQTTNAFIPDYPKVKGQYASDAVFVGQIERSLPRGAAVFQLPYVPFPEYPPVQHMLDYDELRGYLHSTTLRWSYGGIKGRPESDWEDSLVKQPMKTVLTRVVAAGFLGVTVDRFGYSDGGAAVEGSIATVVDQTPIVSPDRRLSFFSLVNFQRDTVGGITDPRVRRVLRESSLLPTEVVFGRGFEGAESNGTMSWEWAKPAASLILRNRGSVPRDVTLTFRLAAGSPAHATAQIGRQPPTSFAVSQIPTPVELRVRVGSGDTFLQLTTDASRVLTAPSDRRALYLQVIDARATDDALKSLLEDQ